MALVLVTLGAGRALRRIIAVRVGVVGFGVGRFACEEWMGRVWRDDS